MRYLRRVYTPDEGWVYIPEARRLSSNFRGMRIKRDSVLIEPRELEEFLRHPDGFERLRKVLSTLEQTYTDES